MQPLYFVKIYHALKFSKRKTLSVFQYTSAKKHLKLLWSPRRNLNSVDV